MWCGVAGAGEVLLSTSHFGMHWLQVSLLGHPNFSVCCGIPVACSSTPSLRHSASLLSDRRHAQMALAAVRSTGAKIGSAIVKWVSDRQGLPSGAQGSPRFGLPRFTPVLPCKSMKSRSAWELSPGSSFRASAPCRRSSMLFCFFS
jgi:hypothetical protein